MYTNNKCVDKFSNFIWMVLKYEWQHIDGDILILKMKTCKETILYWATFESNIYQCTHKIPTKWTRTDWAWFWSDHMNISLLNFMLFCMVCFTPLNWTCIVLNLCCYWKLLSWHCCITTLELSTIPSSLYNVLLLISSAFVAHWFNIFL